MKTLKFILVLFLFVITARLSGDIVKKHTQPQIRVMITNLDNFPDIAVIGLSDCLAFSRSNKAYIVKSGSCLQIYQACPLTLYLSLIHI